MLNRVIGIGELDSNMNAFTCQLCDVNHQVQAKERGYYKSASVALLNSSYDTGLIEPPKRLQI